MVGLFGGSLAISLPTLPIRAVSIIGVFTGTLPEFRELMALAREGKVKPAPIETRALETAQQSLDDLRAGHVRGRIVLTAQSVASEIERGRTRGRSQLGRRRERRLRSSKRLHSADEIG